MPMLINRFGGWLNYPEYFFFWCYHGQNAVFNTMSYQNPKLDKIITNARFAESKPIYDGAVKEMIQLAYDEVPRIPLMPAHDGRGDAEGRAGLPVLVPPAARCSSWRRWRG
jgi:ABC-type oligopeptide transport system substrate-binding subunit